MSREQNKDRDKNQSKQQGEQEQERVRATIMQLSDLTDLIGIRTYVIKRTPRGKSSNPDPWGYTREALAMYAPETDADEVIKLFEGAGCKNELEAVRWLLQYDELVP